MLELIYINAILRNASYAILMLSYAICMLSYETVLSSNLILVVPGGCYEGSTASSQIPGIRHNKKNRLTRHRHVWYVMLAP